MNRRATPRLKVDVLINRFLDGHPYMCRMTDISPTGLRLVPLLEPKIAPKYMGLQFQLPGSDAVLTAAGVAVEGAAGSAGLGVRFTSLTPEQETLIRQLVGSN